MWTCIKKNSLNTDIRVRYKTAADELTIAVNKWRANAEIINLLNSRNNNSIYNYFNKKLSSPAKLSYLIKKLSSPAKLSYLIKKLSSPAKLSYLIKKLSSPAKLSYLIKKLSSPAKLSYLIKKLSSPAKLSYLIKKLSSPAKLSYLINHHGNTITEDAMIAQELNNYFSSVYVSDDGVIPPFP